MYLQIKGHVERHAGNFKDHQHNSMLGITEVKFTGGVNKFFKDEDGLIFDEICKMKAEKVSYCKVDLVERKVT